MRATRSDGAASQTRAPGGRLSPRSPFASRAARRTVIAFCLTGIAAALLGQALAPTGGGWLAVLLSTLLGLAVGLPLAMASHRSISRATIVARRLAEGDLDARLVAPLDEAGDEVGELAQALDELRRSQRALAAEVRSSRDTLATVLASVDDGMLVLTADGIVQIANPAAERILSLPEGKAEGRSLAEVARDHELVQFVQRYLSGSDRLGPERVPREQLLDLTMPRRNVRAQTAGLADGRTLVVLQDLTALRRADTIRRDFVANVSHELRTPLASLKALVETLQAGALEDPPAARDFLERMDVELDGLTQLVRELLDLSRIEAGRDALELAEADVAATVAQAAERLRSQADRAGVALTVDLAPDIPAVRMDAAKVQQALINLLHNAVKFTPPGGRASVLADLARLRSDGSLEILPRSAAGPVPSHVVLTVEDTGVGIAASDLPRIFERFYKVDRARSGGGTGLGLAIVKHIAEAHGGRVWAESVEGQGATFRVALPIRPGRY